MSGVLGESSFFFGGGGGGALNELCFWLRLSGEAGGGKLSGAFWTPELLK